MNINLLKERVLTHENELRDKVTKIEQLNQLRINLVKECQITRGRIDELKEIISLIENEEQGKKE